ncbi:MAG: aspartyl/glutamyl-tRNA(Asn/Gln) amidotransferase subunit C [Erysipelotrichaceae bacterium]|nr:MAG: aspartyl/glutamyl-tRNA(Asn/Gln) amidotransferase subunit [Erysipelotrichaceae bacterium]TXT17163.1 MAG: aspartyl/glutamyl-tRNA(Asn/Gln) amidotransferase subunit C [Erysipelotrichaceae bacterium]
MEKQSKSYFIHLAHQLRFDLGDKEAQDITDEFNILIDQMDLLNKIDTQGVEPMVYPFEEPTSFMREDVVNHVLSALEALKNAPSSKNGFFVTKKVVL